MFNTKIQKFHLILLFCLITIFLATGNLHSQFFNIAPWDTPRSEIDQVFRPPDQAGTTTFDNERDKVYYTYLYEDEVFDIYFYFYNDKLAKGAIDYNREWNPDDEFDVLYRYAIELKDLIQTLSYLYGSPDYADENYTRVTYSWETATTEATLFGFEKDNGMLTIKIEFSKRY